MGIIERPKITLPAARVNAGMNQREMAEFLGVDVSTITNWDKGKTEPSTRYLEYLWIIFLCPRNPKI